MAVCNQKPCASPGQLRPPDGASKIHAAAKQCCGNITDVPHGVTLVCSSGMATIKPVNDQHNRCRAADLKTTHTHSHSAVRARPQQLIGHYRAQMVHVSCAVPYVGFALFKVLLQCARIDT